MFQVKIQFLFFQICANYSFKSLLFVFGFKQYTGVELEKDDRGKFKQGKCAMRKVVTTQ
jgi:hypothetical protein